MKRMATIQNYTQIIYKQVNNVVYTAADQPGPVVKLSFESSFFSVVTFCKEHTFEPII